jgi:hypothetical protein
MYNLSAALIHLLHITLTANKEQITVHLANFEVIV